MSIDTAKCPPLESGSTCTDFFFANFFPKAFEASAKTGVEFHLTFCKSLSLWLTVQTLKEFLAPNPQKTVQWLYVLEQSI